MKLLTAIIYALYALLMPDWGLDYLGDNRK